MGFLFSLFQWDFCLVFSSGISVRVSFCVLAVGHVLSGAVLQGHEGGTAAHQPSAQVSLCQGCCLSFLLVGYKFALFFMKKEKKIEKRMKDKLFCFSAHFPLFLTV